MFCNLLFLSVLLFVPYDAWAGPVPVEHTTFRPGETIDWHVDLTGEYPLGIFCLQLAVHVANASPVEPESESFLAAETNVAASMLQYHVGTLYRVLLPAESLPYGVHSVLRLVCSRTETDEEAVAVLAESQAFLVGSADLSEKNFPRALRGSIQDQTRYHDREDGEGDGDEHLFQCPISHDIPLRGIRSNWGELYDADAFVRFWRTNRRDFNVMAPDLLGRQIDRFDVDLRSAIRHHRSTLRGGDDQLPSRKQHHSLANLQTSHVYPPAFPLMQPLWLRDAETDEWNSALEPWFQPIELSSVSSLDENILEYRQHVDHVHSSRYFWSQVCRSGGHVFQSLICRGAMLAVNLLRRRICGQTWLDQCLGWLYGRRADLFHSTLYTLRFLEYLHGKTNRRLEHAMTTVVLTEYLHRHPVPIWFFLSRISMWAALMASATGALETASERLSVHARLEQLRNIRDLVHELESQPSGRMLRYREQVTYQLERRLREFPWPQGLEECSEGLAECPE